MRRSVRSSGATSSEFSLFTGNISVFSDHFDQNNGEIRDTLTKMKKGRRLARVRAAAAGSF
jgi:hypothetical protein